jgi:phosphate transport system permease protein
MIKPDQKDKLIKAFFGGNALMAIVILGLITFFLFKEGIEFFGENRDELNIYRKSGMEYASVVSDQHDQQTLLFRYFEQILAKETEFYEQEESGEEEKISREELSKLLIFSQKFQDIKDYLLVYEKSLVQLAAETKLFLKTQEIVAEIKAYAIDKKLPREDFFITLDEIKKRKFFSYKELDRWQNYFLRNEEEEIARKIDPRPGSGFAEEKMQIFNYAAKIQGTYQSEYLLIVGRQISEYSQLLERFAYNFALESSKISFEKAKVSFREYVEKVGDYEKRLEQWDPEKKYPWSRALTTFLFGKDWVTNSARQDWFGVIPLFTGSLLVTVIALVLAIPLGVGSAVYVNQVASSREQALIKPCIEFISAIPSVVIGFFGIAVLGGWIAVFSDERLNSLTAGCLLALMAVPTIFTLAEDSLNNVPRAFKEASLSLGATRWQTVIGIIFPCALSGIVSAILLGLGRVIGETMVVLLCAGNRIAIPDFSSGLGVFIQPVHTMTGIIAQEMGEVEFESIHYRALFMVGVVLFLVSMLINYCSQVIARKYKSGY